MRLYYDDKTRRDEIYDFYQLIFQDPKEFADYYFEEMYPQNTCLLLEEKGRIGAMLHQNPYEILIRGEQFELSYLVAVATRQDLRRRGCMRKLLQKTLKDLARKGQPFTYLMPAKKEYYEPFDFAFIMDWYFYKTERGTERNLGKNRTSKFQIEFLTEENSEQIAEKMNEARRQIFDVFTKMDETLLGRLEKEQICEGGHIFQVKEGERTISTGMYTVEETKIRITNLFFHIQEKKEEVISFLRYTFSQYDIEWVSYDDNLMKDTASRKPMIMARILRVDMLLPLVRAKKEQTVVIEILDEYLEENQGCFLWKMNVEGSTLERTKKEPDFTLKISDLTKMIFGYEPSRQREMQNIIPLCPVHITEVV